MWFLSWRAEENLVENIETAECHRNIFTGEYYPPG